MAEEKFLTVRDVSSILDISEKEVVDLAEKGVIPAYKIGGVYLRFKREQVQEFKKSSRRARSKADTLREYSLKDRVSDFLYFNDFYILASIIIALLLFIIFKGY